MTATGAATEAAPRARVLPDPRLVELMVATTALVGGRLNGRLPLPVGLLVAVVAAHGLVLARWPARRGLRLACFALLLVLLGVVPTARYVQATERGNVRLAIDGGVLVSDQAVRVLLQGRDPYQASYAQALAGWRIDVEGRPAANPLAGHYPYWPGSLALLAAVEAAAPDLGRDPDHEQHHHGRDQQLDRKGGSEGEPGHDDPAVGQGDRGDRHAGHQ